MKSKIVCLMIIGILLGATSATLGAKGAISKSYHGMWGAGGCKKAKYFMHIEGSGMQMYAADKRMPLGNWDVRKVQKSGNGIIIDTKETNSNKATHMELTKLKNGHLSMLLKIEGNGGKDELIRC